MRLLIIFAEAAYLRLRCFSLTQSYVSNQDGSFSVCSERTGFHEHERSTLTASPALNQLARDRNERGCNRHEDRDVLNLETGEIQVLNFKKIE